MRLARALLTATLLTGSLVACSSGNGIPQTTPISTDGSAQTHLLNGRSHWSSTANVVPVELRSSSILAKLDAAASVGRPDMATRGIYALDGNGSGLGPIYGYSGHGSPVCGVGPVTGAYNGDIAVDRQGDLIVPEQTYPGSIVVFAGPGLCGAELGSITDPYPDAGPIDVASRNVQSPTDGKIVVGHLYVLNGYLRGGVAVCTLSGGCTRNLTVPRLFSITGVALARNGDCWASGNTRVYVLVYYAHCRGHGVITTGYKALSSGGLDIDENGNLLSISLVNPSASALYVHSGCNPACTLVGGPFQLLGTPTYGHLDASSKRFITADYNELDVYSYSTSGITNIA